MYLKEINTQDINAHFLSLSGDFNCEAERKPLWCCGEDSLVYSNDLLIGLLGYIIRCLRYKPHLDSAKILMERDESNVNFRICPLFVMMFNYKTIDIEENGNY